MLNRCWFRYTISPYDIRYWFTIYIQYWRTSLLYDLYTISAYETCRSIFFSGGLTNYKPVDNANNTLFKPDDTYALFNDLRIYLRILDQCSFGVLPRHSELCRRCVNRHRRRFDAYVWLRDLQIIQGTYCGVLPT